jgi:threonine/homoserine/homoserine lactone efflux protein
MLIQAAGLALLAALTPTALLVSAVFLGSASPRRTGALFLAGAIVMTVVMAVIVFVVLRATHLQLPHQHKSRYGLRLGLGVLLLLASGFLLRRGPKVKDPAKRNKGLISRLIARPGPRAAFVAGLIVYSPSVTFIAAIQVVATSRSSTADSVGAIALVIGITVLFVWLPLLLHVLMPDRTSRVLTSFNGWLRAHGRALGIGAMLVGGVVLTLNGILGLTGVL